ncbi:MAG: adenosylcobamide-dependent radical SAM protein [Fusobacteria bacterium]|nr:MAG: adenosylcobamide-dependent radical SAM protein [Fusobacteriota bacterium]KAF0229922.1 MAG: adenosylcobamide-dependent radical SAM [Fusobacteriota bacterium]
MKIGIIGINSKYIHKNLAIYALYSYVKDLAIDIDLLEFSINESIDKVFHKINRGKYDALCFATYVWNKETILKLAENFKTINSNIKIVLGGPEICDSYEKYPFIDHLIIGEGEIAFRKLLENKFSMPKLLVREMDFIDLNDQPFVYEDILDQLENKIVYYEGSRGCPFHCTYCLSGSDNTLRLKSSEKILTEIKILVENGVKQVKFIDRTFNANVNWSKAIVEGLFLLEKYKCNFHFEVSLDKMNDSLVQILHESPDKLFQLEIGIQTTNADTLKAINRNNDFSKIKERIKLLLSKGNLHLHTDLIAGLPYEDLESFKRSFNEIYMLKAQMLQVGFLKVIPNTTMYKEAANYGIKYRNYPPYEILKNSWLSSEDLLEIKYVEEAVDSFYNKKYFRQTFVYLMSIVDDHFSLFRNMGELLFNMENLMSLNDKYEFLYNYLINSIPNLDRIVVFALLQLDWYLTNKMKRLPYFLRFEKSLNNVITLPIEISFIGHDISVIKMKPTNYKFNYDDLWSIFDYPSIDKA